MARALVSPNEHVYTASSAGETRYRLNSLTGEIEPYQIYPKILIDDSARIVQVVTSVNDEFEVAAPLFWTQCAANVTPGTHYYDTASQQIKPTPRD